MVNPDFSVRKFEKRQTDNGEVATKIRHFPKNQPHAHVLPYRLANLVLTGERTAYYGSSSHIWTGHTYKPYLTHFMNRGGFSVRFQQIQLFPFYNPPFSIKLFITALRFDIDCTSGILKQTHSICPALLTSENIWRHFHLSLRRISDRSWVVVAGSFSETVVPLTGYQRICLGNKKHPALHLA